MLEAAINNLFLNYQISFEDFNVKAVREFYSLPCQLTTPGRVVNLNSEQEFKHEFEAMFDAIKSSGF